MTKTIELRQDRGLIRSNFDGYKLSLEPVPLLRQELTSAPMKAEANDEQYSLLHAELFSMQNLLTCDPWARTQSYFINRLGEIVRCAYDENKGRPDSMKVVYRLSPTSEHNASRVSMWKQRGEYNYTMRFISEKYCILCDGVKTLFLLETGDRLKANEWQQVTSSKIESPGIDPEEIYYVIYDARLDIIQEQKQVSLALGHVQRVDSLKPEGGTTHFLNIHWAKWTFKEQMWHLEIIDTLEGKGSLYYCAFEPRSESLVLSSNREFIWRSLKVTPEDNNHSHTNGEKPQLHNGDLEENAFEFSWSQTDEDIVVKFNLKPGMENDYKVKCDSSKKISVKCKDLILLDHDLKEHIDHDLTTWTIENNFLQITLVKKESLHWTSLLANDLGPKEDVDGTQQNCLPMEQQPIPNLEAPIEDCDFPMGAADDEITISRFHLPTRQITHTVMCSNPPLFTTSLRPGFPLAIATRQDVDASLWLQQYNPAKPDEWTLRHEGNLHAFGYVQASKQQRKFMDCSPDLGYAIISESHRHVFLYKSKYDTASGLRNRNGPQVTIGKQHLVTLDEAGEVLGLSTANCVATLLTDKFVLFIQMES